VELADMTAWGYRKTGTGSYYLPGKLDLSKF
jgi:hypothetical protein